MKQYKLVSIIFWYVLKKNVINSSRQNTNSFLSKTDATFIVDGTDYLLIDDLQNVKELSLIKNGDGWNLKVDDYYIGGAAGANSLTFNENVEDSTLWSITIDSENNVDISHDSYNIKYNSGSSPRF